MNAREQTDVGETVIEAQAAEHRMEMGKLSDLAWIFLNATDGDTVAAERLLDEMIDLLFEDGALSTWRYRIVLANVREGL